MNQPLILVRLLENNPSPLHPWLNAAVVCEELEIQRQRELLDARLAGRDPGPIDWEDIGVPYYGE